MALRASGLLFAVVIIGSGIVANAKDAAPAADGDGTELAPNPERMNSEQLQAQAKVMHVRITEHALTARRSMLDAQQERDSLKLMCVRDALIFNEALLNLSDKALVSLDTAVHNNDREQQVSSYKRIADAALECEKLGATLQSCAGAREVAAGKSSITVQRPKLLDNPTNDCNVLGSINCIVQPIEYVAFASPFGPN